MAIAWILFLIYVCGTLVLAWLGSRKTTSLESYAIGDGTMHPLVVGLALAASMTSTATLVINPGIVFAYGVSALFGYGVAAALGLTLGIVVLSKGFRKLGLGTGTLTVPAWLGQRYSSQGLRVFYAIVNLLLVAMVVLICYAMAGLMIATLGLTEMLGGAAMTIALAGIILFVFAYTFFGGTFAHVYTNTAQGLIMLVVAVVLIASGIPLLTDGFFSKLAAIDPNLASPVNPSSILFRNLFEVFGANFLVGVALSVQPHFLIKALYVKRERDVNLYLGVAIVAGILFNMVMLCGLYARVGSAAEVGAFMQASGLGIDGVMPGYIVTQFSPVVGALISIALLAAGMSTLDGILVALSAIFASDVYLVLRRGELDTAAKMKLGLRVGRWTLIVLGVLAFGLSLLQHYRKEFSVAIFAQEGVYALFSALFVPVLFGFLWKSMRGSVALTASLVALAVHFGFRYGELSILTDADYTNPGLTAAYALIASLLVVGVAALVQAFTQRGGSASSSS